MSGSICPCCGQPIDEADLLVSLDTATATRRGISVRLRQLDAVMLKVIRDAYPRAARYAELICAMWPPPRDEPDGPGNNIKVRVSLLRRQLETLGVHIATTYGVGYVLQFDKNQPLPRKLPALCHQEHRAL